MMPPAPATTTATGNRVKIATAILGVLSMVSHCLPQPLSFYFSLSCYTSIHLFVLFSLVACLSPSFLHMLHFHSFLSKFFSNPLVYTHLYKVESLNTLYERLSRPLKYFMQCPSILLFSFSCTAHLEYSHRLSDWLGVRLLRGIRTYVDIMLDRDT